MSDVIAKQREKLQALAANRAPQWYSIEVKADKGKKTAEVYIYAEIGDNFWGEGVSASDFVKEFAALDAEEITVHLNSPGGNFWDSVAIANSLRSHPAKVITRVDGLAASGASIIAVAGDEVVMSQGAQMMVHEASGLAFGTAEDMAEVEAVLDKISDNMAGLYAKKAGGTVAEWRDIQKAETWYNDHEAVTAKLADRVDETVKADEEATAKFNLAVFAHAGRNAAPAPRFAGQLVAHKTPDAKSAAGQREGDPMSDELKKALRERLGETDESKSEEDLLAALDARLAAGPPEADAVTDPEQLSKLAKASGAVLVDSGVWAESQRRIEEGVQAAQKLRDNERDQLISAAVEDGRIPPTAVEHWKAAYDANPKGIGDVIAKLARNLVPVTPTGYGDDSELTDPDFMGEFSSLFRPGSSGGGR